MERLLNRRKDLLQDAGGKPGMLSMGWRLEPLGALKTQQPRTRGTAKLILGGEFLPRRSRASAFQGAVAFGCCDLAGVLIAVRCLSRELSSVSEVLKSSCYGLENATVPFSCWSIAIRARKWLRLSPSDSSTAHGGRSEELRISLPAPDMHQLLLGYQVSPAGAGAPHVAAMAFVFPGPILFPTEISGFRDFEGSTRSRSESLPCCD